MISVNFKFKKKNILNLNGNVFQPVHLGTKKHHLDTFLRQATALVRPHVTSQSMVCFCCFSYPFVCSIRRFYKCFRTQSVNSKVCKKNNLENCIFEIWFSSIRPFESECDRIEFWRRKNKSNLCRWIESCFCRWFKDTTDVFSPLLLMQLIATMLLSACSVFHLDLVIICSLFN